MRPETGNNRIFGSRQMAKKDRTGKDSESHTVRNTLLGAGALLASAVGVGGPRYLQHRVEDNAAELAKARAHQKDPLADMPIEEAYAKALADKKVADEARLAAKGEVVEAMKEWLPVYNERKALIDKILELGETSDPHNLPVLFEELENEAKSLQRAKDFNRNPVFKPLVDGMTQEFTPEEFGYAAHTPNLMGEVLILFRELVHDILHSSEEVEEVDPDAYAERIKDQNTRIETLLKVMEKTVALGASHTAPDRGTAALFNDVDRQVRGRSAAIGKLQKDLEETLQETTDPGEQAIHKAFNDMLHTLHAQLVDADSALAPKAGYHVEIADARLGHAVSTLESAHKSLGEQVQALEKQGGAAELGELLEDQRALTARMLSNLEEIRDTLTGGMPHKDVIEDAGKLEAAAENLATKLETAQKNHAGGALKKEGAKLAQEVGAFWKESEHFDVRAHIKGGEYTYKRPGVDDAEKSKAPELDNKAGFTQEIEDLRAQAKKLGTWRESLENRGKLAQEAAHQEHDRFSDAAIAKLAASLQNVSRLEMDKAKKLADAAQKLVTAEDRADVVERTELRKVRKRTGVKDYFTKDDEPEPNDEAEKKRAAKYSYPSPFHAGADQNARIVPPNLGRPHHEPAELPASEIRYGTKSRAEYEKPELLFNPPATLEEVRTRIDRAGKQGVGDAAHASAFSGRPGANYCDAFDAKLLEASGLTPIHGGSGMKQWLDASGAFVPANPHVLPEKGDVLKWSGHWAMVKSVGTKKESKEVITSDGEQNVHQAKTRHIIIAYNPNGQHGAATITQPIEWPPKSQGAHPGTFQGFYSIEKLHKFAQKHSVATKRGQESGLEPGEERHRGGETTSPRYQLLGAPNDSRHPDRGGT